MHPVSGFDLLFGRDLSILLPMLAVVAQLVERLTRNEQVIGSSPINGFPVIPAEMGRQSPNGRDAEYPAWYVRRIEQGLPAGKALFFAPSLV